MFSLPFLDLRSPFKGWFSTIKYWLWSFVKLLCHSCGDEIPCSVWFVLARAIPHSFLPKPTETPNDLFWNCLACSTTSFCVFETCLLVAWFPLFSVSFNVGNDYDSASETTRLRGSQECLLLIWIAVWPEKMCQWNLQSARDIIFVHECRRLPCFRKCCRPGLIRKGVVVSHTQSQSQRTDEPLFSITVRLVVPTQINYCRIMCPSFCHKEIPLNSGVQFCFAQS